jgi:hypothetical protein
LQISGDERLAPAFYTITARPKIRGQKEFEPPGF